jgi:hypothetical protein
MKWSSTAELRAERAWRRPQAFGVARMSAEPSPEFEQAAASLRASLSRTDITLVEVPAPQRLAPQAVALSGELLAGEDELASGRLVLLHDPAGHETWQSTFRLVTFVRADVEAEIGADPMLPEVGWSWLLDALASRDLAYRAASGTVTRVLSQSFGSMDQRPATAEVEIRASWSPADTDMLPHVEAWCELLRMTAGLPATPDVPALRPRRPVRDR